MKYIDGTTEQEKPAAIRQDDWPGLLPDPVDTAQLERIDRRIHCMHRNYELLIRRNRLLSAIAILEQELKTIEDAIERLP
jgi:hypothetical protein